MTDASMAEAAPAPAPRKPSIPSPCIGVCEMDEVTGMCAGCARTAEELDTWRDQTDAYRQAVWDVLPQRLEAIGVTVQRLKLTSEEILDFIETSIQTAQGSWVLGVYGAVGEFMRAADEPVDIVREEKEITAVTGRGALHFTIGPAARLLAIGSPTAPDGPRAYCLAVHRSLVSIPVEKGVTELGVDKNAIRAADREMPLFDLGLGRTRARFMVRTHEESLLAELRQAEGADLETLFSTVGASLLRESPARIVQTAMGRVEVETAIPLPDGKSPAGPHTHLLPDHLAQGLDGAPGLAIPSSYAIGALFYPKRADVDAEQVRVG